MATIKDVAKLAGVSVSTVSRVLNQSGYVNTETEQIVLKAIDKLQYVPNALARSLSSKKTQALALILPDISNPFFPELARAVEDVARSYGYTVFLCNSDGQREKEKSYIEIFKKKYIDGIIFASNTLGRDDIEKLHLKNIPMVVLDRTPAENFCSIVKVNNFQGAQLAVKHLLQVGCKKIAHIYGPQNLHTARERLRGYEETVKDFPWFTPSLMLPGSFSLDGGRAAVSELLERHPDVDGIFASNDLMAIGALKELYGLGFKVPEQIAICGFDGIKMSEVTEPELTTVIQPIYEMGALATKTLIHHIEGLSVEKQFYELEVKLIERKSTRRVTV